MRDLFLPKHPKGIVYGLFASDEPLQIRYVGQTIHPAITRLKSHIYGWKLNQPFKNWIKAVLNREAQIGLRVLGRYPVAELIKNERKWIDFWGNYCELFNQDYITLCQTSGYQPKYAFAVRGQRRKYQVN